MSREAPVSPRPPGWWFAMVWAIARFLAAVMIVVATVEQVRLALEAAAVAGIGGGVAVVRLLSFFTVQSNLIAAMVLTVLAVRAVRARGRSGVATFLAAASTYMLATGVVYNIVLRSAGDVDIMLGWSNDVHHVIAPLFFAVDVVIGPGRRALRWWAVGVILVYPIVWVMCTLVAGPFLTSPSTGSAPWYPYPFLDPALVPGGYVGVVVWVAAIAATIAVMATLVIVAGRLRAGGKASIASVDTRAE